MLLGEELGSERDPGGDRRHVGVAVARQGGQTHELDHDLVVRELAETGLQPRDLLPEGLLGDPREESGMALRKSLREDLEVAAPALLVHLVDRGRAAARGGDDGQDQRGSDRRSEHIHALYEKRDPGRLARDRIAARVASLMTNAAHRAPRLGALAELALGLAAPRSRIASALVWSVLATAAGTAVASEGFGSGVVAGRVLDVGGEPLRRATLTVEGGPAAERRRSHSDTEGRFQFGLAPGVYSLSAELAGFLPHRLTDFTVEAGAALDIDITLERVVLDALRERDVRSTSKRAQSQREAPGVVGVVTREQATLFGWTSLDDVLYRQPGFAPAQDYDRRTVGARGLFEGWNNNHVLHLVDGLPWNDNLYGTAYTWEITPLSMAKTIEIARGPGSSLYGSYAANGVVEVETVSASDLEGGGMAEVRAGNAGTRVYELLAGYGAGRAVSAVLGYTADETDGNQYSSHDGSARLDDNGELARFDTRDGRSSHYFWAKLEGGQGLEGLALQYHEQYWDFETGHGWLWWIPDFRESMAERRRLASLAYRPSPSTRFTKEYAVRFQRHAVDWSTRYYPDGAFDGFYPTGMWEDLDTHADDIFARAQLSFDLGDRADLLVGVEADRFTYGGDREHTSNVDVDAAAGGFPPFPGAATQRLGPWLDYLLDQPIDDLAAFVQLSARRVTGTPLGVTLGARWDHRSFDFDAIDEPGRPERSRRFDEVSPRLAVVVMPSDTVTVKLLGSRAFRAPTPTELAGAHTFSLASNIEELEPERIATGELFAEWWATRTLTVRAGIFHTHFENQIAYSPANLNLSTNLFTTDTSGVETELLYTRGRLSGFLNHSWARRDDEKSLDATIASSPDRVAWAPAQVWNAGMAWTAPRFTAALSIHRQGTTARRASDVGVQVLPYHAVALDLDAFRSRTVDSWTQVDGRVSAPLPRNLTLAIDAQNLFDEERALVKVLPFPFDYRQETRRVVASLRLDF